MMESERVVISVEVSKLGPGSLLGALTRGMSKMRVPHVGTVVILMDGVLDNVGADTGRLESLEDNIRDLRKWLDVNSLTRLPDIQLWFASTDED